MTVVSSPLRLRHDPGQTPTSAHHRAGGGTQAQPATPLLTGADPAVDHVSLHRSGPSLMVSRACLSRIVASVNVGCECYGVIAFRIVRCFSYG